MELKGSHNRWSLKDSLDELARLADTAGAEVAGMVTQRLNAPSHAYYVGKGKLEELVRLKGELSYDLAIFDDELSPVQQRNIENALQVKVIDRTALILDIFARRAGTREGKLQVELAQHEYLLPRLAGRWSHLERLGGGIGTRGPGETQLETDRRLISTRIHHLKQQLEDVSTHRALYRRRRSASGIPVVALVGYTNAGKSTLLNRLSHADVLVEDKLFSTLDPTTRRLMLPDNQEILLTDTVGFIQKLPTTLVAAFRATLEELNEASLLLHIVDITHKNAVEQSATVEATLAGLGLKDKPIVTVLNKMDLFTPDETSGEELIEFHTRQLGDFSDSVALISAAKGWGIERLLRLVGDTLTRQRVQSIEVMTPYPAMRLLNLVQRLKPGASEEHPGSGAFQGFNGS